MTRRIDLTVPFHTRIDVDCESRERESGLVAVDAKSAGPPLHRHMDQDERWVVVSGVLSARIGNRNLTLREGETIEVPRSTPHTYWNAGDVECAFRYELTPGHRFTAMMRTFERLAANGRIRGTGDPRSIMHMATVFRLFHDHVQSVSPPAFVMKAASFVGRTLGVVAPFDAADAPAPGSVETQKR